ncbi:hypothetical protein AVEN_194596-1 [Araneus ventricosus]|uniref:Uncharacterized protein n=1 Tax=Araneus ventricosus TaxID=182803 RepID=A0A4Y2A907_ARAVE|nr:hypothetical protein AVEN_194596-1 [Araneus ventricosus]
MGSLLFSDESRICLQSGRNRLFVWREPWSHYYPNHTHERDRFGGSIVSMWVDISLDGHTVLYIVPKGAVNPQLYRDYILDRIVRPCARPVGDFFILQDDNARQYRFSKELSS